MKCVSYTRATTCLRGEEPAANVITQQNQVIHDYTKKRGWRLEKKASITNLMG